MIPSQIASDAAPYRQPREPDPAWMRAGGGLRWVAWAMLAGVVLDAPFELWRAWQLASMFTLQTTVAHTRSAPHFTVYVEIAIQVVVAVVTLVGLWRFRDVPVRARAASSARFAFLAYCLVVFQSVVARLAYLVLARTGSVASFGTFSLMKPVFSLVTSAFYYVVLMVAVFRATEALGVRLSRGVVGVVIAILLAAPLDGLAWGLIVALIRAPVVAWSSVTFFRIVVPGLLVALFARFLLRGARVVSVQTDPVP